MPKYNIRVRQHGKTEVYKFDAANKEAAVIVLKNLQKYYHEYTEAPKAIKLLHSKGKA